MNNLNLLQQLIARWKAKSPKFFNAITTISTIALFITGVPELLQEFGVVLPEAVAPFASKVIAWAALAVTIIGKLTVDTPQATNNVLKQIDDGVKPEKAQQSV